MALFCYAVGLVLTIRTVSQSGQRAVEEKIVISKSICIYLDNIVVSSVAHYLCTLHLVQYRIYLSLVPF